MKKVYLLELIEETDDECRFVTYGVFSTREKAEEKGEELVYQKKNYVSYEITIYPFFEVE